jgi:hypothetical protein
MNRREFIAGISASAWPAAAWAQQSAMPVVGLLLEGESRSEVVPEAVASFIRGLAEARFVEGRNVAIEYRWENGETGGLRDLAADLVRRRVAVIATPRARHSPPKLQRQRFRSPLAMAETRSSLASWPAWLGRAATSRVSPS